MKTRSPQYIKNTELSFHLPQDKIIKIIKDFHCEMSKGLKGNKSSLAMIPTFAFMPTGKEKGKFIALDLGGTNFRVLEVLLDGDNKIRITAENKFKLQLKEITGTSTQLFNFIADKIRRFLQVNKISPDEEKNFGFTFSFPIKQISIKSGILLFWTKEFSASGVVGHDVVVLLKKALRHSRIGNIKTIALLNDTTGTLAARAYCDRKCNLGIILGTGTNACYPEKISNIKKLRGRKTKTNQMIINTEWGNFDKLPRTPYDKAIDKGSINPNRQTLEKMVSGLYIGEIARLVILDFKNKELLFKDTRADIFKNCDKLKAEHISMIDADNSRRLDKINTLLKRLNIPRSTYKDRKLLKKICGMVLARSASISSTTLAAIILWMDPELKRKHNVAVDGSLFEKCPNYLKYMKYNLRKIFKNKLRRINLTLTKDGSGRGAAVIAASTSG